MGQEVVREYYNSIAERELLRLSRPYSQIEYQTTLHLIDKYFAKEGRILDIGCGPGRYSVALLEKGYKVSLLDLSQNELDIAKKKINEKGLKAEGYYCQSAMDLSCFEDNIFDGILLMGPMYHLHGEENRQHVLQEVRRILKPGGRALIAFINMWGVLKASVGEFPAAFEKEQGQYDLEKDSWEFTKEEAFTEAYFTTLKGAIKAVEKEGFTVVSYAGAESFLGGLFLEINNLATYMPDTYKLYVKKACEFCELPQYRVIFVNHTNSKLIGKMLE